MVCTCLGTSWSEPVCLICLVLRVACERLLLNALRKKDYATSNLF